MRVVQRAKTYEAEEFKGAPGTIVGDQVANPGDYVVTDAHGTTVYPADKFHELFEETVTPTPSPAPATPAA